MSELLIESPKYGKFVVLYDEADEEIVKRHKTWGIFKRGGTYYVKTDVPLGNGKQKTLLMHRLLTNAPPGMMVDHINSCGWDNRQSNMRVCSQKENCQNKRKTEIKTSSQYKGVYWRKDCNKWCAYIRIDGKRLHLGYFTSEIDASDAYDIQAKLYHGEFAKLNNAKR